MAPYNKFLIFTQDIGRKVHNLNADSLKIALTNTAPVNTNTVLADLTEITYTNASTTSGTGSSSRVCQVGANPYTGTAGVAKLTITDMIITASGGTLGPFRYVTLYNDTPSSPADPLIAWWDYGSSITLNDGETFTIDFDSSNGVLTIT